MLDLIGNGGIVVTIDIDHSHFSCKHPRVITITGDSGADSVVARVRDLCKLRRVMVVHDGDHSAPAVLRDLKRYSEFAPVGSYVIVEDGIQDLFTYGDGLGSKEPGPLIAVRQFLAENRHFVADRTRERYSITYNPEGFLKRIS